MSLDHRYSFQHALLVLKRRYLERTPRSFVVAGELRESFETYLLGLQERLWSGQYIRGSTGHFSQLWIRDLGLFCREYIENGYSFRLEQSLRFALERFQSANRITTTIWKTGVPYNVFGYSSDALPLILWSLHKVEAGSLVEKHRSFLEAQSGLFKGLCLDDQDGFPKMDLELCGLKDAVVRSSNLYAFSMCFLWYRMQALHELGSRLHSDDEWRTELYRRYWNEDGNSFYEDAQRSQILSADVQLIPFWLELLETGELFEKVWDTLMKSEISKPLLIRQTARRHPMQERLVSRLTAPNYQGDTIWANLGAMALCLGFRNSKDLRRHLDLWADLSFRDGELMELYTTNLDPYRSVFYRSDEGMNWSIGFLSALRLLKDKYPPDPEDDHDH